MRWIGRLEDAPADISEPLIWCARADDASVTALLARERSTPEDLADAASAKAADGGESRLRRRLMLKALAARAFGVAASEVRVERQPAGGQSIAAPQALFASAAGRGAWAAVAVAPQPIGVDVETLPPEQPLPVDLLHPEEQRMVADLDEAARGATFLRLWTLKEAYAKAAGVALETALPAARFRLDTGGGIAAAPPGARGSVSSTPEMIAAAVLLS